MQRQAMDIVDDWWSDLFGIGRTEVWKAVTVLPHARLAGYEGFFVAWRAGGVHVSLPAVCDNSGPGSPAAQDHAVLRTPEFWESFAAALPGRLIGPATHHYLDVDPGADGRVVPIRLDEATALRSHVGHEEWSESGFADDDVDAAFGIVEDGDLVAAATLSPWAGRPRDVGVLVAPSHRGRRLVDVVGGAAASYAIREHGLARWVARSDNSGSTGAAHRLGFEAWCTQLAIFPEVS